MRRGNGLVNQGALPNESAFHLNLNLLITAYLSGFLKEGDVSIGMQNVLLQNVEPMILMLPCMSVICNENKDFSSSNPFYFC